MTKFKEYLRAKGIKLECDFEVLPYNSIEAVETRIMDSCIVAVIYSNCAGAEYAVYDRAGECSYFDGDGYRAHVEDTHCDSECVAWLYDNGFTDQAVNRFILSYSPLYSSCSVYVAFLHVKAGIMDEAAFYKLVNKRYQHAINF